MKYTKEDFSDILAEAIVIGEFGFDSIQALPFTDDTSLTWIKNDKILIDNNNIGVLVSGTLRITLNNGIKCNVLHQNPKYLMCKILERYIALDEERNLRPGGRFDWWVHIMGDKSKIHPSAILGIDGASYTSYDGKMWTMPHIGTLEIEKNVEIGAMSYVCRGTLGETRIKEGTRIGHHVGVGHNARVGKNCVILPFSLIGGSAVVGDDCYIAPGAFVLNGSRVPCGIFVKAHSIWKEK